MLRSVVLVSLLLLTLAATRASALDFEGAGVKVGAALMFTNFEFDGEDRVDNDAAIGPSFGAFAQFRLQRRSAFNLVLEANYVRKGYEGTRQLPTEAERVAVDASANYLSLPVLGRVLFNDDDDLTVYAVFGPSLELLLSHDEDALLDDFASWTLAGNVGIGFEFLVADPMKLQIDLRFHTDFTDSYDGGDANSLNSVRQQGVLGTVGLRF